MEQRTAAIFDFDDTLIKGDSLLPFIVGMCGWLGTVRAMAMAVIRPLENQPDYKTALKGAWLMHALKNRTTDSARPVASRMKSKRRWKQHVKAAMERHKQEGAVIVVATGALDLYIRDMCEGLPVDVIFCTEMERVAGKLTGRMLGGNCVRHEKARRIENWLKDTGPYAATHGYGNAPSDLPFLALMTHSTVI